MPDYRFEAFRLTADHMLWRGDTLVPLSPMQRRLLECFCSQPREVLSKATLMQEVWGHLEVSEVSLARTVHGLRRRLADAGARGNLIRNIYGEGYIFTTEVEALAQADPLPQEFERSEAIAV